MAFCSTFLLFAWGSDPRRRLVRHEHGSNSRAPLSLVAQRFLVGNSSVLFRATLHLLPEMGRSRGHFGLMKDFQLWGPTFFWVVGFPWFIPVPPSLLELKEWLDFTTVAFGYLVV